MNLSAASQHNTMPHLFSDSYRNEEPVNEQFEHASMVDSNDLESMMRELAEMQEALDEIAQCVIY